MLVVVGAGGVRHRAGRLVLDAEVDEQRGVAAVVEDHVRALAVRPRQRLLGAPPVLLERLALPGEDRDAGLGDRRRGVILGREDVARRPADLGAESNQRLDQHGGLDRHVQRAGDARALERLRVGELRAGRHQAGHLVLGELDLLAAISGQADVGDLVVGRRDGGHTVSGVGVDCGAPARRAGAGACTARSAASRSAARRRGAAARRPARRRSPGAARPRCAAAARTRDRTSPISCSSSSSRRVRRRWSSAGPYRR